MFIRIGEYLYVTDDNGDGSTIKPGDTYVAKRNLGWEALKCEKNDSENGWIVPDMTDGVHYYYDISECHRVICCWKMVLEMRG